MNILAIIPAKGGSKGILHKNLQKLENIPLVNHTVNCAKKSKLLTRIIVSTDSKEIAQVTKSAGAEIPFIRPKKFAKDTSSQLDVVKHALDYLAKKEQYFPDIVCVLHPTDPLRTTKRIDDSIKLLEKSKADIVLGVGKVRTHPYRSFHLKNGFLKPFKENFHRYYQRQLFPPLYFPTGEYTFWYKTYTKYGKIYGPKIKPLISKSDEINVDVDALFDLFVTEMTLKHWENYQKKFKQNKYK